MTLTTSTAYTTAGTYTTQKSERSKQDGGSGVGNVILIEFDFSNLEAAFSYSEKMPEVYIVGVGDASGKYICGSELAASSAGVPRCPSNIQVDIRNKTVSFNDATLMDHTGTLANIRASGSLQWR